MGMLAQISDAVNAAFAEYKKEFGENAQITDGTEFVTGALLDYTDKMGLAWSDARSPYIVGMFHDLCKCDNYKVVDGKWKYNPNMILPGHGEKSVIMLQNIAPDALTNEEIACIRWHMGAFDDRNNWEYYTRAVAKFPNVMYTHAADMAAAYIVGV